MPTLSRILRSIAAATRKPACRIGIAALLLACISTLQAADGDREHVLAAWQKDFNQVQRVDLPVSGDGAAQDNFGIALSIQGSTALIGAYLDDRDTFSNIGSAYVYVRSGDQWVYQAKLTSTTFPLSHNHWFGYAVAVDGDTAVIGAPQDMFASSGGPGYALVFTRTGTTWTQRTLIGASDGANLDRFGSAVAIDVSTGTIVVGAQRDDNALGTDAGAAYVYTGSGATWTQQAKLIGATVSASTWYGYSVDIDNDTVLVGARRALVAGISAGAAYVHVRSGAAWTEQARLAAPVGVLNDSFGWSCALSGDTAIVGAPQDDYASLTDAGSAYVFTRSAGVWALQGTLQPAVPATGDFFGASVDVLGDRALVGAQSDDTPVAVNSGAGYVFDRNAGVWSQVAHLYGATWYDLNGDQGGYAVSLSAHGAVVAAPHDQTDAGVQAGTLSHFDAVGGSWGERQRITAGNLGSNVQFGHAVDVDGDTAVVGARHLGSDVCYGCGAAFVYERSGGVWQRVATLRAATMENDAFFGTSVAVHGDQILVGSPEDGPFRTGAIHRFERSGGVWSHAQRFEVLSPSVTSVGTSLDFDGTRAIVGDPNCFNDIAGVSGGCAFVLELQAGTLVQVGQLRPASGEASEQFGSSVAIDGDTALVGAPLHDGVAGANAGAAFIFTETAGTWTERATLLASDALPGDEFGISVDLVGDLAVVGAHRDDHGAAPVDAGSAYVYQGSGASWSELQRLSASTALASDGFGRAVALASGRLLVGASLDDTAAGSNTGSFFEFTADGGTWVQASQEFATGALAGDQLGQAVALSGSTALVGAHARDSAAGGGDAGSAFLYALVSGATTTTITAHTPATTLVGEPFEVSVTVAGSGGTPTGTVSISEGSASCEASLAGGSGSCTLTSTSAGTRTLTASYPGGGGFDPSVSAGADHVVGRAATATAIVADTPDPSLPGQGVDVQVTLAVLTPGAGEPGGSIQVSAAPSGASCMATLSAGSGSCQLVFAGSGDQTLTANFAGDTNFAESTSAPEAHAVPDGADLVASIDNGTSMLTAGLPTAYQIDFSNAGPDAAMAADASVPLPASLTGAAWTCTAGGGASCVAGSPAGSPANGAGAIAASVDLPAGGNLAYQLDATVAASAQGSVELTASIASAVPDPSPADRSASDNDAVQRVVALSIVKVNGCDFLPGGATTTYDIDVLNAGPSDVGSAIVQDLLPPELASASWTCTPQAGSGCSASGNSNIDQLVDIAAGSGLHFELTVDVALGPEIPVSNTATVTRPDGVLEDLLSDNTSTDTDPIRMFVDGFEVACGGE